MAKKNNKLVKTKTPKEKWAEEKSQMKKVINTQRRIIQNYEQQLKKQKKSVESLFSYNKEGVMYRDVGGLDSVIEQLQSFQHGIMYEGLYKMFSIKPPTGVMLYGPPGTGKTLIAKAISNELEAEFAEIRTTDFMTKWVGEGERKLEEILKGCKAHYDATGIKVVLFFDEAETIFSKRGDSRHHAAYDRAQTILLSYMDGFNSADGLIYIASTNLIDQVDEAVLRPGRFDLKCEVPLPNYDGTLDILRKQIAFKERKANRQVYQITDYERLVSMMYERNMSGAEIAEVLRLSAEGVIRKIINYPIDKIVEPENMYVTQSDIERVIENIKKPIDKTITQQKNYIGFIKTR